jgi:hypothetical protein
MGILRAVVFCPVNVQTHIRTYILLLRSTRMDGRGMDGGYGRMDAYTLPVLLELEWNCNDIDRHTRQGSRTFHAVGTAMMNWFSDGEQHCVRECVRQSVQLMAHFWFGVMKNTTPLGPRAAEHAISTCRRVTWWWAQKMRGGVRSVDW